MKKFYSLIKKINTKICTRWLGTVASAWSAKISGDVISSQIADVYKDFLNTSCTSDGFVLKFSKNI